jgi:fructose-1,6-bisphosphatase/inositol monophosphatase family enzyme
VLDEMYSGDLGGGAFCNDKPLKVSGCQRIEESLVAMSLPARVAGPDAPDVKDFLNLVGQMLGILARS